MTTKHRLNIRSDRFDIFTQVLYPWLYPPPRWSGLGSRSGLKNLFKDSSPLRERTKYHIKLRRVVKRVLQWKNALWRHMCVIAIEGLPSVIALLIYLLVHYYTKETHINNNNIVYLYTLSREETLFKGVYRVGPYISLDSCYKFLVIQTLWLITGDKYKYK